MVIELLAEDNKIFVQIPSIVNESAEKYDVFLAQAALQIGKVAVDKMYR